MAERRPIELVAQRAALDGRPQLLTKERLDCPFCSRNARSWTSLVARAHAGVDEVHPGKVQCPCFFDFHDGLAFDNAR